jgi:ABC-type Fe3+/spermidine/putrescine transport system ATPase subunit
MKDVMLKGITASLGGREILHSEDLHIQRGELVCLLGPSGCGKSTTLGVIGGFVQPDSGSVLIDGVDVTSEPPYRRDVGMVFQSYALFPHMTVFDNVAYGLRARRVPKAKIGERVTKVLQMMALDGLESRYPAQLSGGQQQRVAVARGVVIEPGVLLMDEPLSNLDTKLRDEVRLEFRRLQRRLGLTVLFVTHDQREALLLSDRVVLMESGRLVQSGSAEEIFRHPVNRFAASFVGVSNILDGEQDGNTFVSDAGLRLPLPSSVSGIRHVGIRASGFVVRDGRSAAATDPFTFSAVIEETFYGGEITHCTVRLPDHPGAMPLTLDLPTRDGHVLAIGQEMVIGVDPDGVIPLED